MIHASYAKFPWNVGDILRRKVRFRWHDLSIFDLLKYMRRLYHFTRNYVISDLNWTERSRGMKNYAYRFAVKRDLYANSLRIWVTKRRTTGKPGKTCIAKTSNSTINKIKRKRKTRIIHMELNINQVFEHENERNCILGSVK